MGTGDALDLGRVFGASRGAKISFPGRLAARNARLRPTFGNSNYGGCAKTRQIRISPKRVPAMSQLLRKPEARLWLLSISQAVAMLAFNLLLRVAVS
jgi:hypothetical protein